MFRTDEYQANAAALKLAVETGDQSWRDTVEDRFCRFLLFRAKFNRNQAKFHQAGMDVAPNPLAIEIYITDLTLQADAMAETAEKIMAGEMTLPDAVSAEVTLRNAGWG